MHTYIYIRVCVCECIEVKVLAPYELKNLQTSTEIL